MKQWFNTINKQLLERLPLLWVTRAPWVMLVSLLVHLAFFMLGRMVFKNPEGLQHYNAESIYLKNGILLLSIICSVLIIVVWLIVLFRHNTFKNYYPTRRRQLFSSFVIFFIIFLVSSTFYTSYQFGYKAYISSKYTDAVYNKKLDQANLASAFLTFDDDDYTINQRRFPAPFDTLYCETKEDGIDFSKPYLNRYTQEYQFYTLRKDTVAGIKEDRNGGPLSGYVYSQAINDTTWMVWDKDKVADLSALTTAELSYFNYSKTMFPGSYYDEVSDGNESGLPYFHKSRKKAIRMNQQIYALLKRNNEPEIRQQLASFLAMAEEWNIATNLTTQKWMKLINRNTFVVDKFLYNGPYIPAYPVYDENVDDAAADAIEAAATAVEVAAPAEKIDGPIQQYVEKGRTQYYFDASALGYVFRNIAAIKNYDHWSVFFPVQCWLAFGLAMLLFIFRTSGLSSLIFSIITAAVIAIAASLIVVGLNIRSELFIAYLVFGIGSAILVMPLFFLRKIRKNIQAIFINISLTIFVPYLFLIIVIISLHQKSYYRKRLSDWYDAGTPPPPVLLDQLGLSLNYYLLIAGFLFVLLYMAMVKKWKALPEG